MADFLAKLRQRLYPIEEDVMHPHTSWRVGLGLLCVLALFTATSGRMYSDGGWALNGIPVSGYFLWVFFNGYLSIGVIWELLSPRDERTRNMSRTRRWPLAVLTVIAVTVNLVVVWVFSGAGPEP